MRRDPKEGTKIDTIPTVMSTIPRNMHKAHAIITLCITPLNWLTVGKENIGNMLPFSG